MRSALRAGTLRGSALGWSSLLLARSAGSLSDGGVAHNNKELNSQTSNRRSLTNPHLLFIFIIIVPPLHASKGLTQRKPNYTRTRCSWTLKAVRCLRRALLPGTFRKLPPSPPETIAYKTLWAITSWGAWLFLPQQCVLFNCEQIFVRRYWMYSKNMFVCMSTYTHMS